MKLNIKNYHALIIIQILDGNFEITNTYKSNYLKDFNRKSLERLWLVLKPEKDTVIILTKIN